MASETFPSDGTRIWQKSVTARSIANILRTEMENGVPKQSIRGSRRHRLEFDVAYRFSAADWPDFKDWWRDDINNGSDWFNWDDAEDGLTKDARIVGGNYTYRPVNPMQTAWIAEFTVEVMS